MCPLNFLVVDDHEVVRIGMREYLTNRYKDALIYEAKDANQAFMLASLCHMHIALVDYRLPGLDGLDVTRSLLEMTPSMRIVVFSGSDQDNIATLALQAGAETYIPKHLGFEALDRALSLVVDGWLSSVQARRSFIFGGGDFQVQGKKFSRGQIFDLNYKNKPDLRNYKSLTLRQQEVLFFVGEGKTNKEIAKILNISTGTVKNHVSAILDALCAKNRTHATIVAKSILS